MGFDLYGMNPIEQEHDKPNFKLYETDKDAWHKQYEDWLQQDGTYFRSNVWWWRRLASYVLACCHDFIPEDDHQGWHENGGHTVSSPLACKIAQRMQIHIDHGDAKKHEVYIMDRVEKAKEHNKFIDKQMSDLLAKYDAKHFNKLEPEQKKEWEKIYDQKDWDYVYPFTVKHLESFIKFCKESGGFEIC